MADNNSDTPKQKIGQKHPTPTPGNGDRVFYETLYRQRPESEMAQEWCVEYGVLPEEEAAKLYKKIQKRKAAAKSVGGSSSQPQPPPSTTMSEHKTTSRVTMSPQKPAAVEDRKPAAIEAAEDNDMKPTAQVKPPPPPSNFTVTVSTTIDTTNGSIRFIKRTLGELKRNGQGPKNGSDKEILKKIQMKLLKCISHIDKIMIMKGLKVVNIKDSTLILKVLLECVNSTGIYYIKTSRGWKVGASFSLSDEGGYYGRVITQLEEDEIEINEDNAYVCMSLEEMQDFVLVDPQLRGLLSDLMKICPAFIGYYDDDASEHKQKLFNHLLISVFETYFAFAIDDNDPGYIAERLLNFGSNLISEYLQAPEQGLNAKPISWLCELRQDIKVYILETWETYLSAIRALIRENDMCNNDEVMAMLRPELYHGYLNRYTMNLVWGNGGPNQSETSLLGEEPFPDALSCPIIADVKDVAKAIKTVLEGLRDDTITQGDATSEFKELLERITRHKKAYAPPSDNDLRAGGEERLKEIIASVKSQPQAAALISTERALIDLMDDNDGYWGKLIKDADSCEVFAAGMEVGEDQRPIKAGTLYKIVLDGKNRKTLLIYVTYSPHVVLGHGSSYPDRLSQGSRMIANTSIFEAAGLAQEESTDIIIERFRFFFINAEGPFGDLFGKKEEEGRLQSNFYFAARLSLPPGYYIPPIRSGVQALAHAISPGMLKHHAISLMALLGYDNFCAFLTIHCNLELGPAKDFEMELEKIRKDFGSFNKQQQRLKRKEILQILMTPEEQRSIDDWSVLDDWVMTYGAYGTTRYAKTTQAHTEATLVVDSLDKSSTNDEFSAAAKEVHSTLCKNVITVQWQGVKKRQFYLFLLAAGYSEGIIGKLRVADADIYFGSPNQSINQSTNVDPDIDELITSTEY